MVSLIALSVPTLPNRWYGGFTDRGSKKGFNNHLFCYRFHLK
jgi:hypothetical protein